MRPGQPVLPEQPREPLGVPSATSPPREREQGGPDQEGVRGVHSGARTGAPRAPRASGPRLSMVSRTRPQWRSEPSTTTQGVDEGVAGLSRIAGPQMFHGNHGSPRRLSRCPRRCRRMDAPAPRWWGHRWRSHGRGLDAQADALTKAVRDPQCSRRAGPLLPPRDAARRGRARGEAPQHAAPARRRDPGRRSSPRSRARPPDAQSPMPDASANSPACEVRKSVR